ncbi:hypothetical protein [Pseudotamlana carrageenivorans]|uniref:Uncharacterized protein n=1 Tax=Pseudotamlana carrageenivorans TaxID=2069432 RepID=A0A2I7SHN0_9FLAO|nr:hypothetical protein [Tamlana carrageenivorans]AUS05398.1 hypothetical protein C1A40_07880 [Tamlana carrageenivorans]
MKTPTLLQLCLFITTLGFSQTNLTEGDIAITGFNSEDPDQFSFVILTDITNGTSINFTDKGWVSAGGFPLNSDGKPKTEGIVIWTATSDLPCGTEIIVSETATDSGIYTATVGEAKEEPSDLGFALASNNSDQIIAFQGTNVAPTMLFAIHFGSDTGWTDAKDSSNTNDPNNSEVPAGLTDGVNAVYLGNLNNAYYNCSANQDQTLILESVVNPLNWVGKKTVPQTLGGCTYTCSSARSCIGATTTWDGFTWDNGLPKLTNKAIISGNYSTSVASFKCCNLTVNSGITLTVENNTYIEVENDVIINGNLTVENRGNFVQNDQLGIFIVNPPGTAILNKESAVKSKWYHYTYWSSPVEETSIDQVFANVDDDRRFYFEAYNFIDNNGDDTDDNGDDWQLAKGSDIMLPGTGYACTSSRSNTFPATDKISFKGSFNTGDVTTAIAVNPQNSGYAWNLIGNPYPSAIDFVAFQQANATVIDGAAYFWSQATEHHESHVGNQQSNFHQNDYATYTIGSGGAAGASKKTPGKYISTGQSFFVPGLKNGTVKFTNAMRMADNTSNSHFFKTGNHSKAPEVTANKLWLNLTSDTGIFSQILVAYADGATNKNDGLAYDAKRLINENYTAILYSTIAQDMNKYVVQGKHVKSINEDEIIKLGFSTNLEASMNYELTIDHVEGDFLTSHTVYLVDHLLNISHKLKEPNSLNGAAYTFTSEIGEFNNRFEVVFKNHSLTVNKNTANHNFVKITALENNHIQFNISKKLKIKTITIYDIYGRTLYQLQGKHNIETYHLPQISPVFIAKVALSNHTTITKKVIKN